MAQTGPDTADIAQKRYEDELAEKKKEREKARKELEDGLRAGLSDKEKAAAELKAKQEALGKRLQGYLGSAWSNLWLMHYRTRTEGGGGEGTERRRRAKEKRSGRKGTEGG